MEIFSRLPFISNCKLIVFTIVFYICGHMHFDIHCCQKIKVHLFLHLFVILQFHFLCDTYEICQNTNEIAIPFAFTSTPIV